MLPCMLPMKLAAVTLPATETNPLVRMLPPVMLPAADTVPPVDTLPRVAVPVAEIWAVDTVPIIEALASVVLPVTDNSPVCMEFPVILPTTDALPLTLRVTTLAVADRDMLPAVILPEFIRVKLLPTALPMLGVTKLALALTAI